MTRVFILAVLGVSLAVGAALGHLQHSWIFGAFAGSEVGLFVVAAHPRRLFVAPAPRQPVDARVVARLAAVELLRHGARFAIRVSRDASGRADGSIQIPVASANLWWASYVPFVWPVGVVVPLAFILSAFGASHTLLEALAVIYPARVLWALVIALRVAGGSRLTAGGLFRASLQLIDANDVAACEASSGNLHVTRKNGTRAPAASLDAGSSELMALVLRTVWNVAPPDPETTRR